MKKKKTNCVNGKKHNYELVLPLHIQKNNKTVSEEIVLDYYKLQKEQVEINNKIKAFFIAHKLGDTREFGKIFTHYQCSVCKQRMFVEEK